MKRVVVVLLVGAAVVSVVLAAAAQGVQAKLSKGAIIGVVDVGGLTPTEAQKKLRLWWESERVEPLTLMLKDTTLKQSYTATQLGVSLDDVASVAQVPVDGVVGQLIGSDNETRYPVKYKSSSADLKPLQLAIKAVYGEPGPARVKFVAGKIERVPEKPFFKLDDSKLFDEVVRAVGDDKTVQLPLSEGEKKFSDADLAQITDVVSEFSTRFSAGNRPRSSNIKLASSKLNGIILLPGEQVAYNATVGQRTTKAGFREAGVYINGRHDTGIGGGICQVSTTMYNAALFANLKIVKRTNHSLPVPYVPLGRDATVNWGAQDLVLENNYKTPIVITSEYVPGKLTFRVLGKKEPGLEVKIIASGVSTRGSGTTRVFDPSLAPGKTVVRERGSSGRSLKTYRVVYRNGQKVVTEPLGTSTYIAAPTIIAYGPTKSVAPATPGAAGTATVPPVSTGSGEPEPEPIPN